MRKAIMMAEYTVKKAFEYDNKKLEPGDVWKPIGARWDTSIIRQGNLVTETISAAAQKKNRTTRTAHARHNFENYKAAREAKEREKMAALDPEKVQDITDVLSKTDAAKVVADAKKATARKKEVT